MVGAPQNQRTIATILRSSESPLAREGTVKEMRNDQVRSILALPNEACVKARALLELGFDVSEAWTGAQARMTVATANRQFSHGQYAQQATLR
jgi:hypothetical protein